MPEELDEDALFSGRALHVAGALVIPSLDGDPTVAVLEEARARGLTTSLDTVWDATGRWERLVPRLPYLDLFVPRLAEALPSLASLSPSRAAWLRERGVGTVALKLGADSCFVSSEEFEGFVAPRPLRRLTERDRVTRSPRASSTVHSPAGRSSARQRSPMRAGALAGVCSRGSRRGAGAPGNTQSYRAWRQHEREAQPSVRR